MSDIRLGRDPVPVVKTEQDLPKQIEGNPNMNSSHVAIGIGGTSALAALTTVLTGFHGINAEQAAAWAWLICNGAGALVGLGMALVNRFWPAK